MYHNIPLELQQLNQWVCWRYEEVNGRQTKVPYCPSMHNPVRASILNPGTWGSFNDAVAAAMHPAMSGIGFVLTENDPYTGIDIDDKLENPASEEERAVHIKILEAFQSYTERSVGGRGYHIIIRGKINGGRDRGHVGVYSTSRYLTFSGDVVRAAPIAEYQSLLEQLVAQMPESEYHGELDDVEGHLTDAELHEMGLSAANGDKYRQLCGGDWAAMGYPSQSEADFALLSIIAYYTRDNDQVRRMFRYTGLGKREKATRDNKYIDRALRHIRGKQPAAVDIAAAQSMAAAIAASFDQRDCAVPETCIAQQEATQVQNFGGPPVEEPKLADSANTGNLPIKAPAPARAGMYALPPGLVGELAQYFHATAVRPLPEAALVAAIGIVAGVAGRTYNISGTGLNQYILFLAGTGSGKEGIPKGISKLVAATRPAVPMVEEFIGPSAFASGQALVRTMDMKPCFLSILGEFGLTLKAMNDPRAPAPVVILRKVLLDLYGKSGWSDLLQSTAYSDQEKNTKTIHAPSMTVLAESTPDTFYEGIDLGDIADGLIPRFHVVEYTGKRPPRNRAAGAPPPQGLVQQFANLCSAALTAASNNTCSAVQINARALELLDVFDTFCDAHINGAASAGEAQLWNRAHLKALKLAGLLAVGVNPHAPVVTTELAEWSIDFTRRNTEHLLQRFVKGDVGNGETKQMNEVRRVIEEFFAMSEKTLKGYGCKKDTQAAGLVPYRYLVLRLVRLGAFAHDKRGGTRAMQEVVETMVKMGQLSVLSAEHSFQRFGSRQLHYALTASW